MYSKCFYKTVCEKECMGECNDCKSMQLLLDKGKIPRKYQHPHKMYPQPCDEESFEKLYDIAANIVEFVDARKVLYIHSANTGNGKTTWAIRMLLNYFDWAKDYYFEELVGAFVNVTEFLLDCKSNISSPIRGFEEYKRSLSTCRLLVLDDVCVQTSSNYDTTILYSLINYRDANGLATIYTSNVSPMDLYNYMDPRIASRIHSFNNDSGYVIELKGKDER